MVQLIVDMYLMFLDGPSFNVRCYGHYNVLALPCSCKCHLVFWRKVEITRNIIIKETMRETTDTCPEDFYDSSSFGQTCLLPDLAANWTIFDLIN